MSDTDTRSVAEIMGWFPDQRPGWSTTRWHHDSGWSVTPPTPDDMLAWLRGRGSHPLEIRGGSALPYRVMGYRYSVEAPTLHAALEAAVRAVAEAER